MDAEKTNPFEASTLPSISFGISVLIGLGNTLIAIAVNGIVIPHQFLSGGITGTALIDSLPVFFSAGGNALFRAEHTLLPLVGPLWVAVSLFTASSGMLTLTVPWNGYT